MDEKTSKREIYRDGKENIQAHKRNKEFDDGVRDQNHFIFF